MPYVLVLSNASFWKTPQFLQPFSIDSADFPCRDPAIFSPRSFYGQNICSVDIKDIFQSEGFHFSISFMFLNLYRVLSTRLKSISFQYLILFIMYFVFMYLLLTFSISLFLPFLKLYLNILYLYCNFN